MLLFRLRSLRLRLKMNSAARNQAVRTIGRYALFDEIAAGGMATVHLGRLMGPVGFSRTVAIKRLHSHFAKDPDFSAGFVDEARLAARIHHPNVVPIIDVLSSEGELSLVMDYVEGDSLAKLLRQTVLLREKVPLPIASAIVCGSLYGLHAAHEAVDEKGRPMQIVHRDISPQNILVGVDGVPRIVDFGVAKAAQRLQTTAEGQVKGKIAYMSPEQIRQGEVSRQTDVYAMGVVLWETLTGKRLFSAENQVHLMSRVLEGKILPPSENRKECAHDLDALVLKSLSPNTSERFTTAREMAQALQRAVPPAPPTDVSDWVNALALDGLTDRRRLRTRMESQAVFEDGTDSEFLSRPRSAEDELTIAQGTRGSVTSEDASTQAVTGAITAVTPGPKDQTRLFVPLILGLGVVIGVIAAVVVSNSPELYSQPEASPAGAPLSPASAHLADDSELPRPASATQEPQEVPAPPAGEAPVQEEPTQEPPTGTKTSPPKASVGKAPQRPATSKPCPKFIEGADGIRRVNRACWN